MKNLGNLGIKAAHILRCRLLLDLAKTSGY